MIIECMVNSYIPVAEQVRDDALRDAAALQARLPTLEAALASAEQEEKRLRDEGARAMAELEQARNACHASDAKLEKLSKSLQEQVALVEQRDDSLEERDAELQDKDKALKALQDEHVGCDVKMMALKAHGKELEQQLARMHSEIRSSDQQLSDEKIGHTNTAADLEARVAEVQVLEQQLVKLQPLHDTNAQLQVQLDKSRMSLMEQERALAMLQHAHAALQAKLEHKETVEKQLTLDVGKLRSEKSALEKNLTGIYHLICT